MTTIYLIDNFDSFTYNLVDEFAQLGFNLKIYRNNVSADAIKASMDVEHEPVVLVLSPGPGKPSTAGNLLKIIQLCEGNYPMLGVCLGHQAIVEHFGGTVGKAGQTIHGKVSDIQLTSHPIFAGLGHSMSVARYHSLMATTIPSTLSVIAQFEDEHFPVPMAVIHENACIIGLQFHPESILTTQGATLIQQCLAYLTKNNTTSSVKEI
ncbi:aminodeoxychorismate/anthranilate synthase component II [Flocculibacter collagenilyticus]|uniref:aminodeoxychorismate/anthranilate synthase component II n=1 Tax=Flocculibacter collagenilyticus TaxID=2744479 RepID=UPI0018F50401|nr:aminodeoxychorismate/anthranilate synthase component II [Flocculibacter collagenilyticus]